MMWCKLNNIAKGALTTTHAAITPGHMAPTMAAAALMRLPRWLLGLDMTAATRNSVATTHDCGPKLSALQDGPPGTKSNKMGIKSQFLYCVLAW
jgi:hypothetical protein